MGIPVWFRMRGGVIVPSAVVGVVVAYATSRWFYNCETFALDTYKGKSALYRDRKLPQGVDPWKY